MHRLSTIAALFLLSLCVSASNVCIHGHCHPVRPSKCFPVTTVPSGRIGRGLGLAGTEGLAKDPIEDNTHNVRGLGICYYINGADTEHLVVGVPSRRFFLPAGIYILKWAGGFTDGPAADAIRESPFEDVIRRPILLPDLSIVSFVLSPLPYFCFCFWAPHEEKYSLTHLPWRYSQVCSLRHHGESRDGP